ncbi:amidohydrolase [Rossellomorea yichunensis]|jgi:amidohydrolase|uniref:amidohydrolase n=1 Tax=Rossellomorea yichunensis TaxID=3077331 RepID=UPI0028E07CB3|nr:amidohydrolase [Rossellomorea sp. YC4-1]MDT9024268.1 amidohydrolase [Rossellomorea sp. YC4-1]
MKFVDEHHDEILKTYQELHQLAEPSWMEEKTSSYLKTKLSEAGFSVKTYEGHYGFIAELKGEQSEVIALRADMDALLQEVDGVVKPNHSCGHDAHSTMVLYTALALAEKKLNHTVRFIFQPAEEKAAGALKMIEENVLYNVKFLGGIHLRPEMEVPYGIAAPVIVHSSTATLKGTIKGIPAHAARPEHGNNPLEAASLLIQAVKRIRLNVNNHYSIKITELHGGESSNSIPENAHFTFDLRAESNDTMTALLEKAEQVISGIQQETDTGITYQVEEYLPAAVRDPRAIELAREAIRSVLGEDNVASACISPGAEDFHFYSLNHPGLSSTMIGLGCGLSPGLHHPSMEFNQESLVYGTKILIEMLLVADRHDWI